MRYLQHDFAALMNHANLRQDSWLETVKNVQFKNGNMQRYFSNKFQKIKLENQDIQISYMCSWGIL